MKFSRIWAMPHHNTFTIKPIRDLIKYHIMDDKRWVDPFARHSPFKGSCIYTNDLSPDAETTHHMEALEFLESIEGEYDGVLFDPPYSPRQISECYKQVGRQVHMKDTQSSFYGDRKKAAAKLVKTGGKAICCGWNSGGFGKSNGFRLIEVLIVPHGGAHNDTIVTVEVKE